MQGTKNHSYIREKEGGNIEERGKDIRKGKMRRRERVRETDEKEKRGERIFREKYVICSF